MVLNDASKEVAQSVLQSVFWSTSCLPIENAFLLAQVTYVPLSPSNGQHIHHVGLQPSPWISLKGLWKAEGIRGAFRGLSIAVPHLVLDELYGHFRQSCLSTLFLPLVFQLQLDILLWKVLTLPLTILRTNAVATNYFPSLNPLANLRALVQQNGGFWSIWSNWRYVQTALLDWVVFNVGDLVFKHWVCPAICADPEHNSPSIWSTRVAVIVLVTVAYQAFSTIQARLRITDATALLPDGRALVSLRRKPYAGVLDCAQVVVREEGLAALFRGVKEATWIGGPALMSASIAGWFYGMGIQAGLRAGKSI